MAQAETPARAWEWLIPYCNCSFIGLFLRMTALPAAWGECRRVGEFAAAAGSNGAIWFASPACDRPDCLRQGGLLHDVLRPSSHSCCAQQNCLIVSACCGGVDGHAPNLVGKLNVSWRDKGGENGHGQRSVAGQVSGAVYGAPVLFPQSWVARRWLLLAAIVTGWREVSN